MTGAPVAPLEAEALLRTLLEHGVEFVLVGGLAVAAHGYVRATKDVDIVPRIDPENHERLFRALTSIDARPIELGDFAPEEMPVAFEPEGLAFGGNWALETRHGRIDVMQWLPGVDGYEELHAGAVWIDVADVGRVPVAGYDELVRMKEAAGRTRDLEDLDQLASVRGEERAE